MSDLLLTYTLSHDSIALPVWSDLSSEPQLCQSFCFFSFSISDRIFFVYFDFVCFKQTAFRDRFISWSWFYKFLTFHAKSFSIFYNDPVHA